MSTFIFYLIFDVIAIFFFYAGYTYKKIGNKKYILYFLLSFLLLFILIAFRSNQVGTDYEFVGDAFTRVVNNTYTESDVSWFGVPLFLMCKGIGFVIGDSVFAFYFLIAFFSLFFLYKAILKNSTNPTISLFLMISFCLYYQMFNQSRQMLAIVIVLYSYTYLKEKKFWKYFLVILLATMIHNSAFIMMPVYFLFHFKVDKKVFFFYIISSLLLFFSFDLIEAMINLTSYRKYIDTIYNVAFTPTTILNTILRAFLFIISFIFYSKTKGEFGNKELLHYAGLCLLVQVASMRFYFLARLTTYFFIFYLFILADLYQYVITNLKENKKKCLLFGVLFFTLFFLYHTVYYFSSSGALGCGYQEYTFISFKGK